MSFSPPAPPSSGKLCNTPQPLNQQLYDNQKKTHAKNPTEQHCKEKVFQGVH